MFTAKTLVPSSNINSKSEKFGLVLKPFLISFTLSTNTDPEMLKVAKRNSVLSSDMDSINNFSNLSLFTLSKFLKNV